MAGTAPRLLLMPLVAMSAFATRIAAAETNDRPNVILIMADDVGYECFGCYGSKQYRTPNIDRMAADGMLFRHCYSQPLCTPSRIKLMTGVSNVRNYSSFSVLNRDLKTIGDYFQEAGYQTAVVGKWQLLGAEHYSEQFRGKGTLPGDAGFDQACLWQVDKLGSRFWQPLLYVDGKNQNFDDPDRYGPDVVNEYALQFIEAHRGRPFFLYYPMILVHSPFVPTPDSASRRSKDKQRNFEDMVAYMDKLIGRVIDKTREVGIAKKTLILFCGDNGTHKTIRSELDGQVVQGGKGNTTDAGTRVPLVAFWPGTTPAGRVSDDLVDFSDFLPTCLEACRRPTPEPIDGKSFLPQLRGEPGNPRQWIYCYYCPRPERTKPTRFARDQRFKLYGNGRFFDVSKDVLESHPLSDDDVVALGREAEAAKHKLQSAIDAFPSEGQALLQFAP